MVLEHAVLPVGVGQRAAFEAAMRDALPLIAETPVFIDLEIRDCVETPGKYLLLVSWETLAAHTHGFRQSTRYARGKGCCTISTSPFRSSSTMANR